ncbi:hypothetical protein CV770_26630 [Bradyrhizobium sp. AC87j1]|uniref:hypothetical protein n=1 Tax=Bradyrhizobium sp. AC87j1 TaxID=2055894 RepID=UPI000CEC35E0|nr:hypothetical protein [Bradyrhizobium sp. AC87j1]PPQ16325.1 hypothetical protein CV770_26630 [Bradyrhizobium sp. AC87j1]
MAEFERFEQLDAKDFFVEFVTQHFSTAWVEVTAPVGLSPVVDQERVEFAYETYINNLNEIRVRLHSQNPDHYKRAAALLDALNRAEVIQDLEYDGVLKSALEDNTAIGLSYHDCQYRLKFIDFYEASANQVMAFDLAFRCCQAYEAAEVKYSPNYLENMVHYLCENTDQNVQSLYMIFKSYWFEHL